MPTAESHGAVNNIQLANGPVGVQYTELYAELRNLRYEGHSDVRYVEGGGGGALIYGF